MSVLSWLFPTAEMARKEALARIEAGRRQMDESHEAEKPIRDLIHDVLPMLQQAESAGLVPKQIVVPFARQLEVTAAKAQSDAIMGRATWGCVDGDRPAMLFGVPIVDGNELLVICEQRA